MRLAVIATIDDVREYHWLRAFMAPVPCQLLSALGFRHGQALPPDIEELVSVLEVWFPG
jgi:hypothetical protein